MDITHIKEKLLNYGISLENFEFQTGNLVGKTSVPNALRAYNKNLTPESAFYLVANKVFELANQLAYEIPKRLSDDYKNVVGPEIYKNFQYAIYEEINHRFISNSFPEFQNAGSVSISNTSINQGFLGGPSITDWMNPMSRQIIANIDWKQFSDEANYQRDKVFMYRNMENAVFSNSPNRRIMKVLEDGSVSLENEINYAKSDALSSTNEKLEQTTNNTTINTSDINYFKSIFPTLATKEYVDELVTSFPKAELYDETKTYNIPAFVVKNKKIYFNLKNDNIGHTPGGVTGQGWWEEIADVFIPPKETTIVYAAGTDIKKSTINPNLQYYLDINDILDIENLNENTLFNFLNDRYHWLNISLDESNKFYENLCHKDNSKLKKLYGDKIKFYKGQKISFDTKEETIQFIESNNLEESIYKSYKEGTIFSQGDYGETTGSNERSFIVIKENIQKFRADVVGSCGSRGHTSGGSNHTDAEPWTSGQYVEIGVDNPTPINIDVKPETTQEYTICFTRNIYEEKITNYYVNIVDLTIEGHITKTKPSERDEIEEYISTFSLEKENLKEVADKAKKSLFGRKRK